MNYTVASWLALSRKGGEQASRIVEGTILNEEEIGIEKGFCTGIIAYFAYIPCVDNGTA